MRRALGIAMHGPDRLADCATALFRAPLWELVGDRRYGIYDITHPEGAGVLVPAGGDRWLYGVVWASGTGEPGALTPGALARRIKAAVGARDMEPDVLRTGEFTFAAQLAERFAARSTFLVGDAAHRVTPRGGTGMNTAIHDGHDLGWKLAWVLAGWASPDMLDSYERERRPVAEHNVARSAQPAGTQRDAALELPVDLGGRIPHLWACPGISTLDLVGLGLTLFTGPGSDGWQRAGRAVTGRLPVEVRALDAVSARALGVGRDGAVLVRPDGVPTGLWPDGEDAADELRTAVDRLVRAEPLAAVA